MPYVLGTIGVVVVIALIVISMYNSLVGMREKIKNQLGQVEIALKNRFEIIPNLVETVKGYAKHEKSTLEAVIQARNAGVSAQTPQDAFAANQEMTSVLSKLMVVVEQYPELKANQNFLQLQEDLKTTQDKVYFANQFYNDSILPYNRKIKVFPTNIIAGMFGFTEFDYFKAGEEEKQNVKVSFDDVQASTEDKK